MSFAQQSGNIRLTPHPRVDLQIAWLSLCSHGEDLAHDKKTGARILAGAVACMFLLQTLAFVFSSNGRIAFASRDAGASIAMAGEICQSKTDNGGKAPAHSGHHHHCALCSIGDRDQAADAIAILASVIVAPTPRSNDAPAWFVRDEPAPSPLGWTSSWSSRGPPIFS